MRNGLDASGTFKYVGNEVYIWEMAPVFQKRLNYVVNDLDVWEMAQICGELYFRNGFTMLEMA